MCRITGFWDTNFRGSYDLEETVLAMTTTLAHGGPDDAGKFVDKEHCLALGHRRLSIIELSSLGHQPMVFENLIITYNGEIYNHVEVRRSLEELGYSFNSHSDTEVILKAFHKWGIDCVLRFRGMWSFAIWDKAEKKLYLCRDRMGVKPLYWYFQDGLFMFGSELKAFHQHPRFKKEISKDAVALYLKYSYIPAPHCIFRGAHKLGPGSFLVIGKDQNPVTKTYWDIDEFYLKGAADRSKWLKRSEADVSAELEDILTNAFKLRMVSDVPVGMFLSGGVDSSLVTALLQKEYTSPLKTFTIGFNESTYNEAMWARKVAKHLGTDHTELYCTPREAFEVIPKLSEIYDEPFGDASAIPTYLVSKLACQQVKVALSADGGDEQFCGYPRYINIARIAGMPHVLRSTLGSFLTVTPPSFAVALYRMLRFSLPKWKNFDDKYLKLIDVMNERGAQVQFDVTKSYFLKREMNGLGMPQVSQRNNIKDLAVDDITSLMRIDMKTSLIDDMLTKVDRASMSVALENREPFLDNKVIEFSSQMPIEFKYKNGRTKHILKQILRKYVPKDYFDRPKMGFEIPIHDWFKADLKDIYSEYLSEARLRESGIFQKEVVSELLSRHQQGKMVDGNKLWLLCNFEMWQERWMK